MPAPRRDNAAPAPTSLGSRYLSWANSTCHLPSRVRARRAKMSRISWVRSTTARSSFFSSWRSCTGVSSLSKMTTSMSASAHAAANASTLPAPIYVAGSGLGRTCSMRRTTRAPAASASPASSSREWSPSTHRAEPATRPTRAARSCVGGDGDRRSAMDEDLGFSALGLGLRPGA